MSNQVSVKKTEEKIEAFVATGGWVKVITGVDLTKEGDGAFYGDTTIGEAIKYKIKPQLFLFSDALGHAHVFYMDGEGELHPTNIKNDSSSDDRAGQLRIRNQVDEMLLRLRFVEVVNGYAILKDSPTNVMSNLLGIKRNKTRGGTLLKKG